MYYILHTGFYPLKWLSGFPLSFTLEKRPAASPEGGLVSRSVEALVTALPLFVIARLSLYLSCSLRVGFHPFSA